MKVDPVAARAGILAIVGIFSVFRKPELSSLLRPARTIVAESCNRGLAEPAASVLRVGTQCCNRQSTASGLLQRRSAAQTTGWSRTIRVRQKVVELGRTASFSRLGAAVSSDRLCSIVYKAGWILAVDSQTSSGSSPSNKTCLHAIASCNSS